MSDVDGAAVVFKKRAVKSNNARKREMPIKEEEDTEETGSNPTLTLSDIKLQQTIRQRKTGLSIDALSKASKNTASSGVDEVGVKTIGSVMGKQYTTEIDYGIQANIPHKKLMDQYIDEKLGLSKSERVSSQKVETPEDQLYKIPEQLKVLGEHSNKAHSGSSDPSDNGIVPAWSTQLAEVALPIHFKVRNIEATERAAAADAAKRQGNIAPIATARYRFNNNEAAPKLHPLLGDFIESYDPSVPRDPLIEQQLQQMKQEEPKHKRSADDHALEQYRKRQMNHRR